MKKILILSAALLTGFFALSCGDSSSEPEDDPNMPAVKIEVGDIADNKATVTAALEKGNFYGAKIVTGVRVSTLTLDYTREIPLIKYVEANGTAAELPFTTQLTDLIFEQDYFCAVIVYDLPLRLPHLHGRGRSGGNQQRQFGRKPRRQPAVKPKTSKRYEKATL